MRKSDFWKADWFLGSVVEAESLFRPMHEFDRKFRDLEQRLSRARRLLETTMVSGGAAAGRSNVSILGAGDTLEKPTLGRYRVDKELGKGATGVVYVGTDPRSGRVAAVMSPEQLAGNRIGGRADLFSLAASMYQLLCGKLPFEGESRVQQMFKIASEPPTDIRSVDPFIPAGLVEFFGRAMAQNPDVELQAVT